MHNLTEKELAEMANFNSYEEYKFMKLLSLKNQLAETDYKAIKFAEGWISAEEYETVKAERQAIRDKINELKIDIFV